MSKKGYIKLYRQISDTPVWTDSDKLKLWLMCLMKATHEGKTQVVGNQIIELKPGQFITGRSALFDEFNHGVKKDRRVDGLTLFRWLNLFEKMEMLNINKTNKYSLVTVLNWDKYQGQRTTDEQQVNIKRTTDEQQMNTNKNVKNVKNDKNNKKESIKEKRCYGEFKNVKLTDDEYAKLQNKELLYMIERLSSYMASKGKQYKSHYATILTWARKDEKEKNGTAEKKSKDYGIEVL